jgi:hypothetical protein
MGPEVERWNVGLMKAIREASGPDMEITIVA